MKNLEDFLSRKLNKKVTLKKITNGITPYDETITIGEDCYKVIYEDSPLKNFRPGYSYIIILPKAEEYREISNILNNFAKNNNIIHYRNFIIFTTFKETKNYSEDISEIIMSDAMINTDILYLGKIDNTENLKKCIKIIEKYISFIRNKKLVSFPDIYIKELASNLKESEKSTLWNIIFEGKHILSLEEELLYTGLEFLKRDLNISQTSKELYIHRNTLIHRLNRIKELTGLNLRSFQDAFYFYLAFLIS